MFAWEAKLGAKARTQAINTQEKNDEAKQDVFETRNNGEVNIACIRLLKQFPIKNIVGKIGEHGSSSRVRACNPKVAA